MRSSTLFRPSRFPATLFIPVADHYPQKCDQYRVPASQTLNVFTRYTDYIGQFVMHCHILDHEDLGMMEVVEVVGEQPAAALPSHGGH